MTIASQKFLLHVKNSSKSSAFSAFPPALPENILFFLPEKIFGKTEQKDFPILENPNKKFSPFYPENQVYSTYWSQFSHFKITKGEKGISYPSDLQNTWSW